MNKFLSVTFSHELPTFKGLSDFEFLFMQGVDDPQRREKLKARFAPGFMEDICVGSCIKVYSHEKGLTLKSPCVMVIPISRKLEKHYLEMVMKELGAKLAS